MWDRRSRDLEEPYTSRYVSYSPAPGLVPHVNLTQGIGRFTIFDEAVVQEADLGVNFFLDESCLGKSRAQSCAELLLELNPEVEGDWHPKKEVGEAWVTHSRRIAHHC